MSDASNDAEQAARVEQLLELIARQQEELKRLASEAYDAIPMARKTLDKRSKPR